MPTLNFQRTKHACYFSYLAMSSVFVLPPVLFLTFREMYGVSYTLLGTLVLVNYLCQLCVDLVFSFFTKYFNVHKTVRIMPLLTSAGFIVYAVAPTLFPQYAYPGLLAGTVIFSIAAGLNEVLLSPLVAALPSDHPERDMSLLHSLYAWGVVTVVLVSTVFLKLFGRENWMYLVLFFAMLPLVTFGLFCTSPLPEMDLTYEAEPKTTKRKNLGLALCVACIFLGSATENTMSSWVSGYLEVAFRIPKAAGDLLGMALFAVLLGTARVLYAKFGKNIASVLLWSMVGAAVCYLVAGLSASPAITVTACVLTGFCTSMLWPGTLILMEETFPRSGLMAYALMAAGGDLGGSVAPQLLGIVVDKVSVSNWAARLGTKLSLTGEQVGMKVGMLSVTVFPLLGIGLLIYMKKRFGKKPN